MRILQIAPIWEDVPPKAYGGTESVVSLLTESLVADGHEVTLAASGSSTTRASLLSTSWRSLRTANDLGEYEPYEWAHVAGALSHAAGFDVIHNHAGELAMAMAPLVSVPMLTTVHNPPTWDRRTIWDRYEGAYNTISRSQQRHLGIPRSPGRFVGHVHNAIDVETFPYQAAKGDDLLFLSRLGPEKGAHHAIAVAKAVGRRLIMAGKVDRYNRSFFEEVLKPTIDGDQIVYVGEADAAMKRELYRTAYCTLLPLEWEEPFGLVMPESMACGTPVIAFRRGAAPELIRHGETGFLVDTLEEMIDAVGDARYIDPSACRRHVEDHFGPAAMTANYTRIYRQLAQQAAARPRTAPVAISAYTAAGGS